MTDTEAGSRAAADPAWLDAQYDARAANPDHESTFERWARGSAQARDALSGRLGLHYGEGPNETLDWFDGPRPDAPLLVFIHGGYWRSHDKALYSFLAPSFVEAGAGFVAVNYDLCPTVSIERIALQMAQAFAWLARELAARGQRRPRVVACGHSAGGHLAAMLLACDWKRVDPALPAHFVSRALGISGLYDLEPLRHAPFIAADLRLTQVSAARVSPANFPPPRGTVLNVVFGERESSEFHRQGRLVAQRWGPRIVSVCEAIPERRHFDIVDDLGNRASRLHALALGLLGLLGLGGDARPEP